MPDPLKAAPAAAGNPPAPTRAARLAKFKREQLIVDFLNRGVSVAAIAAEIGVGEKRMRAIIREILARRMPHPPEEFVAIQVSRLNEAMLIAFSAMSPSNLKAVDRVVKIVRELDRYGGAFAAAWRRPEASRLDAPADDDAAFASAWLCGAEPSQHDFEAASPDRALADRPEDLAQSLEKVKSAPGPEASKGAHAETGRGHDDRPDPETAPGDLVPPLSKDARFDKHVALPAGNDRPQNPAQCLEKVESAPGIGITSQTAEAAAADPVSTHGLFLSLLRSAAGRQDLRAGLSGLRAGTYGVAHQDDGGDAPFAAPAGHARPENLAQRLENMESAPGKGATGTAYSMLKHSAASHGPVIARRATRVLTDAL